MNIDEFIKERDFALTKAVMEDDFEPILAYFVKYDVPIMSTNPRLIQGATYKAAYNCLSLPQNVRQRAKQRCSEIGMSEKII